MKWLLGLLFLFMFIGMFSGKGARASAVGSDGGELDNQQETDEELLDRQRGAHYEDHFTPDLHEDRGQVAIGFADSDL